MSGPKKPCPHVNTAMIAAGFVQCAVCASGPAVRNDREDTRAQEARVAVTRAQLADALIALASDAKDAAKALNSRRGTPDLPAVYASHNAVQRAEEACDIAAHDLAAARGEHT